MRGEGLAGIAIALSAAACVSTDPGGDDGARAVTAPSRAKASPPLRIATFNVSLNRRSAGELVAALGTPLDADARAAARIIRLVRPDVLLLNEFDGDGSTRGIDLFRANYLADHDEGFEPIDYPHVFTAPSNTGVPTGLDLDRDGRVSGPGDARGFGRFPGQYGMVLLSRHPIVTGDVRTFRDFLWRDLPAAALPDDPETPEPADWYAPAALDVLPLSSKSHWDVPVRVGERIIHVLASHPTPPVFDGPEDRNGRRNHDEIAFWSAYVTPGAGAALRDDRGRAGGLEPGAAFVILGDLNADPSDGETFDNPIAALLGNPLVNALVTPTSAGGAMRRSARAVATRTTRATPPPTPPTSATSPARGTSAPTTCFRRSTCRSRPQASSGRAPTIHTHASSRRPIIDSSGSTSSAPPSERRLH